MWTLLLACADPLTPPPPTSPPTDPPIVVDPPAPPPIPAPPSGPAAGTRVVLLGTGTPVPDPERSGPATAILTDTRALLVDAGPGVGRRAAALAGRFEVLRAGRLDTVLLTHLHSDHTTGLPDVWLGGWVLGREVPLRVIGPPGTRALMEGLREAYAEDIALRTTVEELPPAAIAFEVVETTGGLVLEDPTVKVTAFEVPHGTWEHALGFRFEGADGRVVVVSGDTGPSEAVVDACAGCDLLVHEVYAKAGFDRMPDPGFQRYHSTFHTSAVELGGLAARAQAKRVVLTHLLFFGAPASVLTDELRAGGYAGPVDLGVDLGVY